MLTFTTFKQVLIALVAFLATLNVLAQGQTQGYVDFRNTAFPANTSQRIYVNTYGGGSANYAPADTYSVGLYWAPDGTTDESMFIMVGAATGVITGGFFQGGTRAIPTITGNAMFQVRGWTTAYGNSYEASFMNPNWGAGNVVGKSAIIRATGIKDPLLVPTPVSDPITTYGIVGFAFTTIPEPSSVAFGILGASAFLLRVRRRK
jgi:hypothetical protein